MKQSLGRSSQINAQSNLEQHPLSQKGSAHLTAIQAELALSVGTDLSLRPMLQHFSDRLVQLIQCSGTYVFLREQPMHPFLKFSSENNSSERGKPDTDHNSYIPYLENEILAFERHHWCGVRSGMELKLQHHVFHVFRLGALGVLVIRASHNLSNGLVATLLPVCDKLAVSCKNSIYFDSQIKNQNCTHQELLQTRQVGEFKDLVIEKLGKKIDHTLSEIEAVKQQEAFAGEKSAEILAMLTCGFGLMSKELQTYLALTKGAVELDSSPVDIRNTIKSLQVQFEAQAALRDIDFHFACDEVIPEWVEVDEQYLRLILAQLIDNALRNTEQGGEVSFSVSPINIDDTKITLSFEVKDSGCGLLNDRLKALLSLSLEDVGQNQEFDDISGLRFALINQLIQLMGGVFNADSVLGLGSRFECVLPLFVGEQPTPLEDVIQPLPVALLVEGTGVTRIVAIKMLERMGYCVVTARTAAAAFHTWQQTSPKLTLIDVDMPDINCLQLVQTLREQNGVGRRSPIVGFSGMADKRQQIRCKQAGLDALLATPLTPKLLDDIVRQAKMSALSNSHFGGNFEMESLFRA